MPVSMHRQIMRLQHAGVTPPSAAAVRRTRVLSPHIHPSHCTMRGLNWAPSPERQGNAGHVIRPPGGRLLCPAVVAILLCLVPVAVHATNPGCDYNPETYTWMKLLQTDPDRWFMHFANFAMGFAALAFGMVGARGYIGLAPSTLQAIVTDPATQWNCPWTQVQQNAADVVLYVPPPVAMVPPAGNAGHVASQAYTRLTNIQADMMDAYNVLRTMLTHCMTDTHRTLIMNPLGAGLHPRHAGSLGHCVQWVMDMYRGSIDMRIDSVKAKICAPIVINNRADFESLLV